MDAFARTFDAYAHYNRWFNDRLFGACERLTDMERKLDRQAFFRSIHGTLSHLVWADKLQLARFASAGVRFRSLPPALFLMGRSDHQGVDLYDDWKMLRQARTELDTAIVLWTHELETTFIASRMQYANSVGETRDHPVWFGLVHFFNHQAHHRGQVTTLLTQAGVDPGSTDFMDLASELDWAKSGRR